MEIELYILCTSSDKQLPQYIVMPSALVYLYIELYDLVCLFLFNFQSSAAGPRVRSVFVDVYCGARWSYLRTARDLCVRRPRVQNNKSHALALMRRTANDMLARCCSISCACAESRLETARSMLLTLRSARLLPSVVRV